MPPFLPAYSGGLLEQPALPRVTVGDTLKVAAIALVFVWIFKKL